MRIEEIAYAAGIIDGEGSIGIYHNKQPRQTTHYSLQITVTNTNKELVTWLKEKFGGYIMNRKAHYAWIIKDVKAEDFLNLIAQFLIIKKEKAHWALLYRSTFRDYKTTTVPNTKMLLVREYCYEKIRNR